MELTDGWQVAASPPGAYADPDKIDELDWSAARVPGTAAGAVGADGRDFDAEDWWFRCRFPLGDEWLQGPVTLVAEGIATVSEIYLNGALMLEGTSMFASHVVDVGHQLGRQNELVVACRALGPLLRRRRRPAARWRTRVVNAGNLRWYRTMIFGRSPGFAPGPAPVGPWRPLHLYREDEPRVQDLRLRPQRAGTTAVLDVSTQISGPWQEASVRLASGPPHQLMRGPDGTLTAQLRAGDLAAWWPHTHGTPALHKVVLEVDGVTRATRQVGFRELNWAADGRHGGLSLSINGTSIFVRGAVWTPADLISMNPSRAELQKLLRLVRDSGMNMLRIAGTGAYESDTFHDLCDALGILVWQDLMFANLDYPTQDPEFAAIVEREARDELKRVAGRPSLAVVCGNSEVEQQPAMMGLNPGLGRDPFWETSVPAVLAELAADCAYLRSTPCGGELPFHPDGACTHYFGVSGYFMSLADLRRAQVGFASECLAFANVPDVVEFPVHHPAWKQGVARDAGTGWGVGAGWDFDDVRDHYVESLYGLDSVALRRSDHERYLELSRAATGEVMASAMGQWRRAASGCSGALVLWLKDMLPGAGLGVIDDGAMPKVTYHHLRRALSPVSVWMTDEGLAGVTVHVANDRATPLTARLRVALYRDGQVLVEEIAEEIELDPHDVREQNVETMLGHFVDAAWAYRFGPPIADVIVAELEPIGDGPPAAAPAFFFPVGRPIVVESADHLGIAAEMHLRAPGVPVVTLRSRRLAHGVRLHIPGAWPADNAFSLEPNRERTIALTVGGRDNTLPVPGSLSALNLFGQVVITVRAP